MLEWRCLWARWYHRRFYVRVWFGWWVDLGLGFYIFYSWNALIDMRKNDSEMLLVYVDGTYANSYVKIGSSSVPLSSLRSVLNCKRCPRPWKLDLNPKSSIQHLLKSTLIRGKEEENMFMSKYNSDILESFSEEFF